MNEIKTAITEERFNHKGYPCVIIMQEAGHRCGYVGLKKDCEFYNVDYMKIPINCHGGLTYSRSYLVEQDDKDTWWIGFDCAHYLDKPDFLTAFKLFKDYPKTIELLERRSVNDDTNGEVRSLNYCKGECKNIVEQIEELKQERRKLL